MLRSRKHCLDGLNNSYAMDPSEEIFRSSHFKSYEKSCLFQAWFQRSSQIQIWRCHDRWAVAMHAVLKLNLVIICHVRNLVYELINRLWYLGNITNPLEIKADQNLSDIHNVVRKWPLTQTKTPSFILVGAYWSDCHGRCKYQKVLGDTVGCRNTEVQ